MNDFIIALAACPIAWLESRSLRQLRREVADRLAAKQSVAPAGLESDEEGDEGEYIGAAVRIRDWCILPALGRKSRAGKASVADRLDCFWTQL